MTNATPGPSWPRTSWRVHAAPVLIFTLAAMACQADGVREETGDGSGTGMIWHEAEQLGIRFAYPDSFLAGRFKDDPLPPAAVDQGIEPPFQNAVVLLSRETLGDYDLQAMPVGELPVNLIDRSRLASGAFRVFQPDSTYEIEGLSVARFPGYPGPYGDQVHFYVVDLGAGDYVELAAHRNWFRTEEHAETHYDEVIETIIPTLQHWPQ